MLRILKSLGVTFGIVFAVFLTFGVMEVVVQFITRHFGQTGAMFFFICMLVFPFVYSFNGGKNDNN